MHIFYILKGKTCVCMLVFGG